MAKRLILAGVLAASLACKGTTSQTNGAPTGRTAKSAVAAGDRDNIERALEALWDGRVQRIDLNQAGYDKRRIRIAKAHLLRETLALESTSDRPDVFCLRRAGLEPRWVSDLPEPTEFPATQNTDAFLFVSRHYAVALESDSGRRAVTYTSGPLAGLARPPLLLPFTPTGSAAAQSDTMYIGSLGSPDNNKSLESFSLVSGGRGWGYRTRGNLLTSPVVSGDVGDPKLYFVTDAGVVTCVDASNYADAPREDRWVARLEGGVDHELCVTEDTRTEVGGVYVVDRAGVVYCIDRITGVRRWTHATTEVPTGGPTVLGDVCLVPLRGGWCAFHKAAVRFELTALSGPDQGKTYAVMPGKVLTLGAGAKADLRLTDPGVAAAHGTLEIQGEALVLMAAAATKVDGAATQRSSLHAGQKITVGGTVLEVSDPGTAPLWRGTKADSFVGRIGDWLVARRGSRLSLVHAWTGEEGKTVDVSGARLFPVNASDANLFLVGGDAVVYALYPR